MAFCPNCGTAYEPGAKFCRGCGQPVSAPAAPQQPQYQPQQPVYQAPQYQQPVYQTPQYQQPVHQAPPYQHNPGMVSQLPVDFAGMKKQNTTALILCAAAFVLHILAFIHLSLAQGIRYAPSAYVTAVIRFALCAIFPFLAMRTAASRNAQSLKGNRTGAVIFMIVQATATAITLVSYLLMRYMGIGELYTTISILTNYIAGANVFSSLLGALHSLRFINFYTVSNLLHFVSAALYWVCTVLCMTAFNKKVK